jgi:hypothetical protein
VDLPILRSKYSTKYLKSETEQTRELNPWHLKKIYYSIPPVTEERN